MRICGGGQGVGLRVGVTDLSIGGEGQGVVRPTGHLFEPLPLQVGGYQCGGGALVGGSIAQLAVAIVAPGVQLSACRDRTTDSTRDCTRDNTRDGPWIYFCWQCSLY